MLRFILIPLVLITFFIPLVVFLIAPWKIRYALYRFFYGICCKFLGIDITVTGKTSGKRPLVMVSNHISYLDILILGHALPASFVSKAEVGSWPLVGQIAKLTGTLLIRRNRKEANAHVEQMQAALDSGRNLVFFPEGTTGDGVGVLPFKTSLFKLAEEHKIHIQPVSLRYKEINGLPVHRNEKNSLAWIGDMDLKPHLLDFLKLGRIKVEVVIHDVINPAANVNRKELAKECQKIVASGV